MTTRYSWQISALFCKLESMFGQTSGYYLFIASILQTEPWLLVNMSMLLKCLIKQSWPVFSLKLVTASLHSLRLNCIQSSFLQELILPFNQQFCVICHHNIFLYISPKEFQLNRTLFNRYLCTPFCQLICFFISISSNISQVIF